MKGTSSVKKKQKLTSDQYTVLFEKGTEPPFSGTYVNYKEKGVYRCAYCDQELFSSQDKYDSQSGWPSFYDVVKKGSVVVRKDTSHGMVRDEATCKSCGGHLGHVFEDGPQPTGLRYCINSSALRFKKEGG